MISAPVAWNATIQGAEAPKSDGHHPEQALPASGSVSATVIMTAALGAAITEFAVKAKKAKDIAENATKDMFFCFNFMIIRDAGNVFLCAEGRRSRFAARRQARHSIRQV